jgi:hypothetical protein
MENRNITKIALILMVTSLGACGGREMERSGPIVIYPPNYAQAQVQGPQYVPYPVYQPVYSRYVPTMPYRPMSPMP